MALLLRSGALPAPLTVVEERTIGPDLGSDAINMGLTTGLFRRRLSGALYCDRLWRLGVVASLALFFNVVITFGVLAFFGATLTLPNIAGLILSVGMAVDANILINERIREETRNGRSPKTALKLGLITLTALSSTQRHYLGSGGAALYVWLGTCAWLRSDHRYRPFNVDVYRYCSNAPVYGWSTNRSNKPFRDLFLQRFIQKYTNKPLNVLRGRVAGLTTSATLSIASVVLLLTVGLNYGIDFKGGTILEAHLPGATTEEVRHELSVNHFDGSACRSWVKRPVLIALACGRRRSRRW